LSVQVWILELGTWSFGATVASFCASPCPARSREQCSECALHRVASQAIATQSAALFLLPFCETARHADSANPRGLPDREDIRQIHSQRGRRFRSPRRNALIRSRGRNERVDFRENSAKSCRISLRTFGRDCNTRRNTRTQDVGAQDNAPLHLRAEPSGAPPVKIGRSLGPSARCPLTHAVETGKFGRRLGGWRSCNRSRGIFRVRQGTTPHRSPRLDDSKCASLRFRARPANRFRRLYSCRSRGRNPRSSRKILPRSQGHCWQGRSNRVRPAGDRIRRAMPASRDRFGQVPAWSRRTDAKKPPGPKRETASVARLQPNHAENAAGPAEPSPVSGPSAADAWSGNRRRRSPP